ncbi:MAG: T9SS type A sorting domain-containing protein [Bacteroidota bacterium]
MKHSALLSILLFFFVSGPVVGQVQITATPIVPQGPNPFIPSNRGVDFNRSGANPRWKAFYLFGDGHFSINANPRHEYFSGGTHELRVYSGDSYLPTLPTKLTTGVPGPISIASGSTGSRTSNQRIKNGVIGLNTSWAMMENEELIYIIPFRHPSTNVNATAVSGSITLDFDTNVQIVEIINPSVIAMPNFTYNYWADRGQKQLLNNNKERVVWSFDNLQVGETRFLYVKVAIPTTPPKTSLVTTVMIDFDGAYLPVTEQHSGAPKSPRDPNNMDVDYTIIPPHQTFFQQLTYEVEFQNEGAGYARDVFVDVPMDISQLRHSSVKLYHTDAPCTISYPNEQTVRFTFKNIFLPGTQQEMCHPVVPPLPGFPPCDETFTDDQCTSTFSFSVCTVDNLDPGMISTNAIVIFDTEPPLATNYAETIVEPGVPAAASCQQDDWLEEGRAFPVGDDRKNDNLKAFPNPFNGQLEVPIAVNVKEGEMVSIKLFSLSGKQVAILYEGYKESGIHHHQFDTGSLPAGAYILSVVTDSKHRTERVIKL